MEISKDTVVSSIINSGTSIPEHSFRGKEDRCSRIFEWISVKKGGVWHLCTPGKSQQVIFRTKVHYRYAMTLMAMCAHDCPGVHIITFEIMSNHVHIIAFGEYQQVMAFFALFRKRLLRYFSGIGEPVDLSQFDCEKLIPIESLESLRNQICYTNRNNFVVDPDHTPFSYPYGANGYYFMPYAKQRKDKAFGDMSILAKREFIHSRNVSYPDDFIIVDDYFSPVNYCRFDVGEGVFRDARHYFYKLSKNIECYKEIAEQLGDSVFYTDDELNDAIYALSKSKYDGRRPSLLDKNEKIEVAQVLRYNYNADNAKISRLLKLDVEIVDQLFPTRATGNSVHK
ncbi:MAG: hypothetical protein IJT26_04755 [Bacteroidales bacterium]|nr:hypothetical protein [Bacteroidales bacterium]